MRNLSLSLSLVPRIIFCHWDMEIAFRPPPAFYPLASHRRHSLSPSEDMDQDEKRVVLPRNQSRFYDGYYRIVTGNARWKTLEFSAEVRERGCTSRLVGRSVNHRIRRRWGCCSYFRIALAALQHPYGGCWSARLPYCRSGIGPGCPRQRGLYDRTDSPSAARLDTCGPAGRSNSPRPCIRLTRPAPPVHVAAGWQSNSFSMLFFSTFSSPLLSLPLSLFYPEAE